MASSTDETVLSIAEDPAAFPLGLDVARDERGMTLIEVTIVSGIMMVLALGMATFIENSRKSTKTIEVKSNVTNMGSNVSSVASQAGAITQSLNVMD